MSALRRRLRSRRGLTLTELLLAVAIMGILFSAIATGVSAAAKVYRKSVAVSDAQTLSTNVINALENELRYARNIEDTGSECRFDSDIFGSGVSVTSDGGRIKIGGYDLMAEGAYPSGLSAEAAVSYAEDARLFTVEVTITSPLLEPRETTVTIRAMNK